MSNVLFYTFTLLTLVSALLVVVNKNPVNGAMCLLLSLVGLAGLFVMLDAALLAFVLLLVYAGAVVALFLFIIMLLDTRPEHLKPFRKMSIAAATFGGLLLMLGAHTIGQSIGATPFPAQPAPPLKSYAELLFTTYLLPVQLVGFLLLVAMLGVIVLSKRFEEPGVRSQNPGGNP
ncbi:MAG: NADH-quinone oxidoreductase subunit J [Opitutus sp.]|nr:NADH-quinone oxidoreductase subunit J [Opitutus sp.]